MEHKPLEEEDEDGLDEQASVMTWNVLHAKGFETRFAQYAYLHQVFARCAYGFVRFEFAYIAVYDNGNFAEFIANRVLQE